MDHAVMAEDYLKRDIPVIITDAMMDWEASDKFNVQFLHQVIHNINHINFLSVLVQALFKNFELFDARIRE